MLLCEAGVVTATPAPLGSYEETQHVVSKGLVCKWDSSSLTVSAVLCTTALEKSAVVATKTKHGSVLFYPMVDSQEKWVHVSIKQQGHEYE